MSDRATAVEARRAGRSRVVGQGEARKATDKGSDTGADTATDKGARCDVASEAAHDAAPDPRQDGRAQPGLPLAELAYRALEERIVTLRLRPGALLSEHLVAGELGLGRTPVREALQRLNYEGLVTILPRRGVLVSEIDLARQLRMIELRRVVENFVVRMACHRATEPALVRMAEVAEGLEEVAVSGEVMRFMRLDRELDVLLYDMADNDFATRTLRLMSGLTRRFWYQQHTQRGGVEQCSDLHARIARGLVARDCAAAEAALEHLLDHVEGLTRASLDATGPRPAAVRPSG